MLEIACPYCGHSYETEVFELEPNDFYEDEQCPKCEQYFGFEYELEPRLCYTKKLNEAE